MAHSTFIRVGSLFLLSIVVAAQQPNRDPVMDNLFPPELVMAHQKAIALDDAQKAAIRGEMVKAQTRFTEVRFELHDAMEGLTALLKQMPADETQVLRQLEKVLNAEREIKRTQIILLVRIKNKLSADQQARLQKLRLPEPRP